jgi:hypothetical protein
LAADAFACLRMLDGRDLGVGVSEAAELLATVVEEADDGRFRIARKVARDRVNSKLDRDAWHGHKTRSREAHGE